MKQKQKKQSKNKQKSLIKSAANPQISKQPQVTNLSQKYIKQNYSTLPNNPQNKQFLSKQHIINRLSVQLHDKLQLDLSAKYAIQQYQSNKVNRLNKIQNEIAQINRQSGLKLKILQQVQKQYLKKIQQDIKRDDQIQVKLLQQYERLKKYQQKLKLTKSVIKLRQQEDWIIMQKQQKKLGELQNVFQRRQVILGRNKSLDALRKKQLDKQQLKKKLSKEKLGRKDKGNKKNAQEVKQMGRQYLQLAKKMQIDAIKNSVKLMDINRKSIDYLPQIKKIIKYQIQNLSQPLQNNSEALQKLRKNKMKKNKKLKLSANLQKQVQKDKEKQKQKIK